MKELYKLNHLNDNDEAQYAWFYPKTNRLKHIQHYSESETFNIPTKQMPEFHRCFTKVEPVKNNYCIHDRTAVSDMGNRTRLTVKDNNMKFVEPSTFIKLILDNRKDYKQTKIEFNLEVHQATVIRDMLDSFIQRNT